MRSLPFVAVALLAAPLFLASPAAGQCAPFPGPGLIGCGTSAPFGIPLLSCVGAPTVGNASFAVSANVPCFGASPLLALGTCVPAPIPITWFGNNAFCGPTMATCYQLVNLPILVGIPGVPTSATSYTFGLPIPNVPGLVGLNVCVQELNLCVVVAGFQCVMVSSGISITVQ